MAGSVLVAGHREEQVGNSPTIFAVASVALEWGDFGVGYAEHCVTLATALRHI